jgi:hypothetical protein
VVVNVGGLTIYAGSEAAGRQAASGFLSELEARFPD